MIRGALIGALALLAAVGLWYVGNRPKPAAPPKEPVRVERGTVHPNAELADIFTQLEKEWSQAGTPALDAKSATPTAERATIDRHQEEKRR